MPKSIIIEPEHVFAPGRIHFADIPVNAYNKTHRGGAAADYSARGFPGHLAGHVRHPGVRDHPQRDQDQGRYKSITYNHAGPGAPLDRAGGGGGRDGVLRSGPTTTSSARTAATARFSRRASPPSGSSSDDAAARHHADVPRRRAARVRSRRATAATCRGSRVRFFVYGAYSEIFARETGFNRGLGGSMHAFFAPFGIYPNNAIVGGSGSIAPARRCSSASTASPGSWWRTSATPRSAAARSGRASRFSAMEQYRTLWDESLGGGLPIIFNCMNNFYGMGGQPLGETMGDASSSRASAPASIPSRCTPSASTATIRCP